MSGKLKSFNILYEISHRMDVEHVDSQVIGGQVERLKHLLERHLPVTRLGKKDFVTQRMRTQPCRRERRRQSSESS